MRDKHSNRAKWNDESKGIIESNGEIFLDDKYYFINCDLRIDPKAPMTLIELDNIAQHCQSIADAYNHARPYLYAEAKAQREAQKTEAERVDLESNSTLKIDITSEAEGYAEERDNPDMYTRGN